MEEKQNNRTRSVICNEPKIIEDTQRNLELFFT